MKNFRAFSMLLAAILAASLTACGADSPAAETDGVSSDGTTVPETTAIPSGLPEENFDGFEFRVLHDVKGWGTYSQENLDFESETGDVLTDALYRRNRQVEEQNNFVFKEIISDKVKSDLTSSIMAGDDNYDVGMIVYGWAAGTDLLLDFHEIPNVDLSKPWWDQNVVEQLAVGGKLTNALSDLMITHRDGTVAMFFNKKLAEEYKLGDLYDLVRAGAWTQDKFLEAARLVTADLDANGIFKDTDRFGYCGTTGNTLLYNVMASGIRLTETDDAGLPVFTMGDERSVERIAAAVDMLYKEKILFNPHLGMNTGTDGDQSIFRVFSEDRALFMSHGIGSANRLRDMETDFGVLPAPKYDESQETYYNMSDAGKYLVVPKTAPDAARTGFILEALSYEGSVSVIPAYYDTMLKNKLMRDEESIEMLDEYIFPNVVQKGFFREPVQAMLENIKDSGRIASIIASRKDSITKQIEKALDSMLGE
ncbi:MAG: extracellular solute-binding protein [Ruminococcaceae bacterium]|nr:extracellular solute-binding protein [Oscillospiraceae bacterium]